MIKMREVFVSIRGGLTIDNDQLINIETIDSQHFTVDMNCQSSIIDPGVGGGWWWMRNMQPHAKHEVATNWIKSWV